MLTYVLVTPAHNEAENIPRVIAAVRSQTQRPKRWIIVDDRSTDKTFEVATRESADLEFVTVIKVSSDGGHSFARKALAFNEGRQYLAGEGYDAIGNIDADLSFEQDYFRSMIIALASDTRLGITGGTVFTQAGRRFITTDYAKDSVAGAVQLFRRSCLDDIGGGYLPLRAGGIDAAAELMAKCKGWKVEKSRSHIVKEHRPTGAASGNALRAQFNLGIRFHSLGYDSLFFLARCVYRVLDPPRLAGSLAQVCGFCYGATVSQGLALPPEVVSCVRRAQRARLAGAVQLRRRAH